DSADLLKVFAERACRLIGADYLSVALTQPDKSVLTEVVWGNRSDLWARSSWSIGRGGAGRAIAEGTTLVWESCDSEPTFPQDEFPAHHAEGALTVLATPMVDEGPPVGALTAGWRTAITPTAATIARAEGLASYAAKAVESIRARSAIAESAK